MVKEPKIAESGVAVFSVVFVVLAGNLVLTGLTSIRHEPPLLIIATALAFVGSELGLLAIWLGFGSFPLPLRLVLTVPGTLIIFFPFYVHDMNLNRDWRYLAAFNLVVLTMAIPALLVRTAGWRLVRFDWPSQAENWRPEGRPMQFTLRQMFTWTLAVAMVCGWLRLMPEDFWGEPGAILISALVFFLLGAAAYATVWAALGKSLPAVRLLIVSAATAFVVLVPCVIFQVPLEVSTCFVMGAGLGVWTLGGALCLLRMIGWRLVRPRSMTPGERPIIAELIEPASGPFDT